MKLHLKRITTILNWKQYFGCALLALGAVAHASDDVNVRFSWKFKGEYAHMYLAQDMGFYKERNLNVRMGEGAGAPAALGALLQGQEDVVILPAIFAVSAIQKGMPVKIIALYHPKAPIVLISHNMPHVFEVADRIHIHRLGRRLCVIDPKKYTMSDAVAFMTGAKAPPKELLAAS